MLQNITNREYLIEGTAMMTFEDLVFRILDQGSDDRELGRWTFITLSGKKCQNFDIYIVVSLSR